MNNNEQLEDVDPGEDSDFLPDVYFCNYCNKPFDKLGDKFRHIASDHKSEPAPAGYPENLDA
jgi:5-methylcytosine-specific restriction endonuclease McrA